MEHTYKLIANQYGKNKTIYRVIDETGKPRGLPGLRRESHRCKLPTWRNKTPDITGKGDQK